MLVPDQRIRRNRSNTFEHTITGLLTKRSDLNGEANDLRDRLDTIKHDIDAVDRVLRALGFEGDLEAMMPWRKRDTAFGRGKLTQGILDVLREAAEPMTSREIAVATLKAVGQENVARRAISEHGTRVSKALRTLRMAEVVRCEVVPRGRAQWTLIA